MHPHPVPIPRTRAVRTLAALRLIRLGLAFSNATLRAADVLAPWLRTDRR